MKTIRKSILIGLTVLGMGTASLAAHAQTEGRYTHAANQQERGAKMAEFFAKRQAKLHDALKLSGAQEGAWATYQAAIAPQPRTGQRPDRAAFKAMPAPERMQARIAMGQQHLARAQQHLAALTAFYGQLTAEQKATFDQFASRHHRGGRHGGHHGDHQRQG